MALIIVIHAIAQDIETVKFSNMGRWHFFIIISIFSVSVAKINSVLH